MDKRNKTALAYLLVGVAAAGRALLAVPENAAIQAVSYTHLDVYKRQVHGYVERLARTSHKQLAALLHIPGLYRLVPGVFVKSTRSVFGPAAGFAPKELQTGNGVWRVDMMKCPYHDICTEYGLSLIHISDATIPSAAIRIHT